MKLQTATRLALYAILELADQGEQHLSRLDIAKKYDVSSHHLSKVMRELGKAGYVEAVRGVGGGYRFIGNSKRTTLLDIIKIFEPYPLDTEKRKEAGQETDEGRTLEMILSELNDSIYSTLDTVTISTMIMLKNKLPKQSPAD